ncbi:MAG: helix-turn-helix domain-containing protein [gamma proteobacterium symbiont of Taylorina sp.]|nr:helix-turn-helix domain-containing protein [gamma proteobacterium symbiont of Taylorina sp.]
MQDIEQQATEMEKPSSDVAIRMKELAQQYVKPQQSFTIQNTAKILACSVPTIYRLIRDKKLKTFRVGADQRVLAGEISRIQLGEEVTI